MCLKVHNFCCSFRSTCVRRMECQSTMAAHLTTRSRCWSSHSGGAAVNQLSKSSLFTSHRLTCSKLLLNYSILIVVFWRSVYWLMLMLPLHLFGHSRWSLYTPCTHFRTSSPVSLQDRHFTAHHHQFWIIFRLDHVYSEYFLV